jgi:hypothetical protein
VQTVVVVLCALGLSAGGGRRRVMDDTDEEDESLYWSVMQTLSGKQT